DRHPAATQPRHDRAARGELHRLHAVRARVPRLVPVRRGAHRGRAARARRRPAAGAERAGPLRHRLLAVHVLRHLHRGLPVRRAVLGAGARARRGRPRGPRRGARGAAGVDARRPAAPAARPPRRAAGGGRRSGPARRRRRPAQDL
ncbi:MAG: NADH-ubiquinone oxidoreductase chain I, partial [uncultured Solirubrobacteraceae bacterium]